jgi:hypothetical protein
MTAYIPGILLTIALMSVVIYWPAIWTWIGRERKTDE